MWGGTDDWIQQLKIRMTASPQFLSGFGHLPYTIIQGREGGSPCPHHRRRGSQETIPDLQHHARAVQSIPEETSPYCEIPADDLKAHFERVCGETQYVPPDDQPSEVYGITSEEVREALLAPITVGEVARRLSRTSNTAPGPDGITWGDLRKFDARSKIYATVFNRCLKEGRTLEPWKISRTVLIYKEDCQQLEAHHT
ncbi:hypothetical protein J437_LFUL004172 [Ladona fulva]|uniref:Reverse transcriptase n=1 Tax=Ladona fulva TaxID=123851 RepID=A0A8K0NZH8_LADFU|nr:hypothetical protein J437_LFUL004172 [Ladona fulva]